MKKRRRIGLVLNSLPRYSETFFRNKISGLRSQGVEVVLFIVDNNNLEVKTFEMDCKVVVLPNFKGSKIKIIVSSIISLLKVFTLTPKRGLRHFRLDSFDGFSFFDKVKRLIQNRCLLAHNLDWLHFGFGMLAVGHENVAETIGANMAVSFRGFDLYLSPLKHPNCYNVLFKKDIRFHVLSQEMKEDLKTHGIPYKNVHVIPPAINTQFFKPKIQRNESKGNNIVNIVTVARLHWKKGLVYTLEALSILKKQGINFKYTIVGEGQEYERLVFIAYQLGISKNVHFAGKLNPESVRDCLALSDIYLQYSIQEGFCNAVLEAQAMGLLCIVSDAEGLQENILHNITGWVVSKRQPELLAARIQTVCDLPLNEKAHISNQASLRVKNNFDLLTQQHAFINFYNFQTINDYSSI